MTLARIRLLMMALVMLGLTACVTTTVSSFDAKKDLNKAALTYVQIGYGYFEQGDN
ncbi:MAG: type IV pilus assembly protein PilF, partial [Reinekea sp.]